ncbi:PIN domain-containing protein [Rossellomorea vietnamensis]|uniref:PIN domain-containing protein n=1 Tax=Rossellomorea vietnamensis TaxID=218284 RepID=UPI0016539E98
MCLLEFVKNASNGFGSKNKKKIFDWKTIDSFLDLFVFPALQGQDVTNSVVSRNSYHVIKMLTKKSSISIGEALLEVAACSKAIAKQHEMKLPLEKFDIHDFHVWSTAVETECNYIVTKNTRRFPPQIGLIIRIDPAAFIDSSSINNSINTKC